MIEDAKLERGQTDKEDICSSTRVEQTLRSSEVVCSNPAVPLFKLTLMQLRGEFKVTNDFKNHQNAN